MDSGMIGLATSLILAAVIAFPLGGQLREHPSAFYGAALLISAVYLWGLYGNANLAPVRWLTVVFQKGYLSSMLLAVVMFTGCLDRSSALRQHLQPLRGPLSILSFIFILAHLATYVPLYLPNLALFFSARGNVAASLVVAGLLTVLFVVLAVTSFASVRARMSARSWATLQRFSYVLVVLFAMHVGLVLGRSALIGGATRASLTLAVYGVLIVAYAVLRVRREAIERRAAA